MRLSLGDAGRSQALLRILAAHRLNGALMKPPPLKYWVLAAGVAVFHFIATFNLFGYIMACGGSFTPCTTPMWVGVSYLVLTFPVFYVMPTQWAMDYYVLFGINALVWGGGVVILYWAFRRRRGQ